MKTPAVIFVLIVCTTISGFVGHFLGFAQSATIVEPVVCPAEPSDAWIRRRIAYCDQECPGSPFVADVTADRVTCSCERPGKLERSGR